MSQVAGRKPGRKSTWTLVGAAALIVAGLVIPIIASVSLDVAGVAGNGEVIDKVEWIEEDYGKAIRQMEVTVRYQARGEEWDESTLQIDEDTYDRLALGSRVPLRCQAIGSLRGLEPWIPATRLRGQDTWDWSRNKTNTLNVWMILTLLGAAPFVLLGLKLRGFKQMLPLMLYLLLAGIYWLTPVSEPAPVGETGIATAKVRKVHHIGEILSGGRSGSRGFALMRPMELAEIEFVPEGRKEPVVATDRITAGSSPGLVEGASVPITYQKNRPRVAQMHGGRRDYGLANMGTLVLPWVVAVLFSSAAFAVLILGIWVYATLARSLKRKPE